MRPSPPRRLLAFALGLAALGGSCEWIVRGHQAAFTAATHRALAKAAVLDEHGPVETLFFGTSRLQDGVSPRLFAAELGRLQGRPPPAAYNLAFTSSGLPALESLAARYLARDGLRLAVVELSVPQLGTGALPDASAAPTGGDTEARLTAWVHAHARAIALRQALVSDNIVRLPSLLWFGAALDGSETRVTDQLAAYLGHREAPADFDAQLWEPQRWSGAEAPPGAEPDAEALRRLVALAQRWASRGVRTAFVVPPVTEGFAADERTPRYKALFHALAARSGAPVWDFSDTPLPDALFRGESHLGRAGRASFSVALAREVARAQAVGPR